jgi:serine/threonine protein kinase
MMPWLKLDPSWLPSGTLIGPWKVKAFHGGGAFSAVFRAVRARREHGGWVALKVASSPWDPRFQREAVLLSRIRHPGVPRFLGRGEWKHPDGAAYPFVVMEWVEGVPLYEWAAQSHPSAEELCRVLTQLAWALEATHAAEGVHRDVKGDNIRIVPSGLRAVLMDFGAGNYTGAARLTREGFPPGTDTYRSPEAWEFALHRPRNSTAVYEARPADDVFALGVSAYRLVTGTYPPPMDVREEEAGPAGAGTHAGLRSLQTMARDGACTTMGTPPRERDAWGSPRHGDGSVGPTAHAGRQGRAHSKR